MKESVPDYKQHPKTYQESPQITDRAKQNEDTDSKTQLEQSVLSKLLKMEKAKKMLQL